MIGSFPKAAFVSFLASLSALTPAHATLNERLGFRADEKVLILHIDDLGSVGSANRAARDILKYGMARSGSIMATAPYADHAISEAAPNDDLGLHITLNSEWTRLPCRPAAGAEAVPSLVDDYGNLLGLMQLAIWGRKKDIETEIEAQIKKALALGMKPTHIDTHVGTVFFKPTWFFTYMNMARKYRLAPMIPRWSDEMSRQMGWWGGMMSYLVAPLISRAEKAGFLMLDFFYIVPPPEAHEGYEARKKTYVDLLRSLKPGVSEIVFHPAYADGEFLGDVLPDDPKLIFRDHEARILQDPEVLRVIQEQGIRLIGWREINAAYDWNAVTEIGY